MKKYKLINKQTGEEHLCDKVTIDGFDYYMNTETSLSNNGDWYLGYPNYNSLSKWEMVGMHEGKQVWINKVIATNNSNIDIPKVMNEVEKWIDETASTLKDEHTIATTKLCLKAGYNKSQETHPFSEEDVKEIFKIAQTQKDYGDYKPYTFEEAIRIWKEQQPKTLYYE